MNPPMTFMARLSFDTFISQWHPGSSPRLQDVVTAWAIPAPRMACTNADSRVADRMLWSVAAENVEQLVCPGHPFRE